MFCIVLNLIHYSFHPNNCGNFNSFKDRDIQTENSIALKLQSKHIKIPLKMRFLEISYFNLIKLAFDITITMVIFNHSDYN